MAIYSMILLVRTGKSLTAGEIANKLFASRHHVMKVLHLLLQNNYLGATRGPKGGYFLKKDATDISLLEIYEAVSGEVVVSECSWNREVCPFAMCVFDKTLIELKMEFKNYLKYKTLAEYASS